MDSVDPKKESGSETTYILNGFHGTPNGYGATSHAVVQMPSASYDGGDESESATPSDEVDEETDNENASLLPRELTPLGGGCDTVTPAVQIDVVDQRAARLPGRYSRELYLLLDHLEECMFNQSQSQGTSWPRFVFWTVITIPIATCATIVTVLTTWQQPTVVMGSAALSEDGENTWGAVEAKKFYDAYSSKREPYQVQHDRPKEWLRIFFAIALTIPGAFVSTIASKHGCEQLGFSTRVSWVLSGLNGVSTGVTALVGSMNLAEAAITAAVGSLGIARRWTTTGCRSADERQQAELANRVRQRLIRGAELMSTRFPSGFPDEPVHEVLLIMWKLGEEDEIESSRTSRLSSKLFSLLAVSATVACVLPTTSAWGCDTSAGWGEIVPGLSRPATLILAFVFQVPEAVAAAGEIYRGIKQVPLALYNYFRHPDNASPLLRIIGWRALVVLTLAVGTAGFGSGSAERDLVEDNYPTCFFGNSTDFNSTDPSVFDYEVSKSIFGFSAFSSSNIIHWTFLETVMLMFAVMGFARWGSEAIRNLCRYFYSLEAVRERLDLINDQTALQLLELFECMVALAALDNNNQDDTLDDTGREEEEAPDEEELDETSASIARSSPNLKVDQCNNNQGDVLIVLDDGDTGREEELDEISASIVRNSLNLKFDECCDNNQEESDEDELEEVSVSMARNTASLKVDALLYPFFKAVPERAVCAKAQSVSVLDGTHEVVDSPSYSVSL